MVLYRKYRPQTLGDLIGQEAIKKSLQDSFQAGKLSHAYLFVGPRGTGKTSTARILAKMVNCVGHGSGVKGQVPCNKCDVCLSITDGSNLDLIEIDAASNRGIDDVRALRENIKLSPANSKKKIYIIDEVHMLTQEAFNALLKTLEEPPSHAMFILATTEVSKVPQTILSRVTRLDFKLAKQTDLVTALTIVARGEGIKIEPDSLSILAQKAEGSFRDAVKLLDQLASTKIALKDVMDGLSLPPFDSLVSLLELLAKKDGAGALLELNKQIKGGVGTKDLILQLMEILRSLVFIKNGLGASIVKEDFGSDRYQKLNSLAESFSLQDLIGSLDSLQRAWEKLKVTSIASLPLELAIVEMTTGHPERSEGSLDSSHSPQNDREEIVASSLDKLGTPRNDKQGDIATLQEKWTFILETIKPYNFSLEALLRSVKIQSAEGGLVVLEVPYSFHQRILDSPKSKDLLESVISEVLAKPTKVSTALGNRPQRIEDVANIEVAADDEVIRLASEIFNGKLVD